MNITQFSEVIRAEFGPKMEHATPANVRKFMEKMHQTLEATPTTEHAFVIPRESATNYEQVVVEFLSRVLELPPEQAVIRLWLFTCEQFFARLGEDYEKNLADLITFNLNE